MNPMLKLHIGSGQTRIEGFVNIDQIPGCDLHLDLNVERLPFDDNSVDVVFSYHALEHFDNYLFVLGEIWRVLRHGGRLLIEVPYVTLSEFNLVNPYHKHHFSEHSFDFFEIGKLKASANEDSPILFTKGWHRFHYLPEFEHTPEPERTYARRHFFNVVRAIDLGLYAVKPPAEHFDLAPNAANELQSEFERHFNARVLLEPSDLSRGRPPQLDQVADCLPRSPPLSATHGISRPVDELDQTIVLRSHLSAIYSSTSWRVALPIRTVAHLAGRPRTVEVLPEDLDMPELQRNIEQIHRSSSWRITGPLRILARLLRKGTPR